MGKILKNTWKSSVWLKFLTITSVLLIIVSFILPPIGVIDGSVLACVGELEIFGALWIIYRAIETGTGAHLSKGDMTMHIEKKEE